MPTPTSENFNFDNSYARLPEEFYSKVNPTSVSDPELLIFNQQLAEEIGVGLLSTTIYSGNEIPSGALPIAQAYAGHQFGGFNMLGDGRAILLGEHITPSEERIDIQLKGSGRTPYSRSGDGRAAIGPMLREYIISEAMAALGIPTTRSLAVVKTGEPIYRDNAIEGAILTRVAKSHIRVGTFQYAAALNQSDLFSAFTDYTIKRHYPQLVGQATMYIDFLNNVVNRQAQLIAKWMQIGFIHGVMNTDNMSICGETIDYGPCAYMNIYNPHTVFSSIDRRGRYAYLNQPEIAQWNLARFAETLISLLSEDQAEGIKLANLAVYNFKKLYKKYWIEGMQQKLGIFNAEDGDLDLITDLLSIMQSREVDYTNSFRDLSGNQSEKMIAGEEFTPWHARWKARLGRQQQAWQEAKQLMDSCNPYVIPRNYFVEEALTAASKGDMSATQKLLSALSAPFVENTDFVEFRELRSEPNYKTFCGT